MFRSWVENHDSKMEFSHSKIFDYRSPLISSFALKVPTAGRRWTVIRAWALTRPGGRSAGSPGGTAGHPTSEALASPNNGTAASSLFLFACSVVASSSGTMGTLPTIFQFLRVRKHFSRLLWFSFRLFSRFMRFSLSLVFTLFRLGFSWRSLAVVWFGDHGRTPFATLATILDHVGYSGSIESGNGF